MVAASVVVGMVEDVNSGRTLDDANSVAVDTSVVVL